jgi:hypothetical protein
VRGGIRIKKKIICLFVWWVNIRVYIWDMNNAQNTQDMSTLEYEFHVEMSTGQIDVHVFEDNQLVAQHKRMAKEQANFLRNATEQLGFKTSIVEHA